MADHGARDHATWSASATARNVTCAGALALARFAPPEKESIHSARGTACHQISEKCLRTGADPLSFLGQIEKTKQHEIEIDDELVASAEAYVGYVREASVFGLCPTWVEQNFSLADLDPPFDAGGTGDAVIHHEDDRRLEVVDLKNGMGVVDVNENPQLRTYGLGALLANPKLDVDKITVTIVQPRAPHKDGRIRSETFHVADLIDWTADLLKAMRLSKKAIDDYDAAAGNTVLLDLWAERYLKPGKCTFCPVQATCPALRKKVLAAAEIWLDDAEQPRIGNRPDEMSTEKLAETLDMLEMIEAWIGAVRGYAHALAEQGATIPGYQLVDKIGNRKWIDETAAVVGLVEAGIERGDVFAEPKLKSPAQMEKLLGAKRKALIEPFVTRPVTGTNLVSAAKTTRPAAAASVMRFLDPS